MPDVTIVGAGVFGLSIGWSLAKAGADVQVFDPAPASGASGGIVGALTPHAPTRWRPMMAFQYAALMALQERVDAIEAETGSRVGYARNGRLTPLATERDRARAEADVVAAKDVWGADASMDIIKAQAGPADWITEDAAPFGIHRDTVSARIDPRAYTNALVAALGRRVRRQAVTRIVSPRLIEVDGEPVGSDHVIVAAGWQALDMVSAFLPGQTGQPVKGQAALFEVEVPEGLPVIYQNGLYIVPHGTGRVAVGSTSEKSFESLDGTDERLDAILVRARATTPILRDARVIERWSGLRPKPPGREPLVGPVPDQTGLWIATGGYKIGFGIAHKVGDALTDMIMGRRPDLPLPDTFLPARFDECQRNA